MKELELNRWLPTLNHNPESKVRLFCFPYAGSSAMIFNAWPGSLPEFIEVCPVELPGRGRRLSEPPLNRMEPLVESLATIFNLCSDKPFAFFGHSMGALLSFEVSKKLYEDFRLLPVHLFVSAHRAPHLPKDEQDIMYHLPEPEFIARLKELNGMPDDVLQHNELMELLLPILRADFAVCETYKIQRNSPLPVPITAFGGTRDQNVPRQTLDAWQKHTTSDFRVVIVPGDHFFLNTNKDSVLQVIAKQLNHSLANL